MTPLAWLRLAEKEKPINVYLIWCHPNPKVGSGILARISSNKSKERASGKPTVLIFLHVDLQTKHSNFCPQVICSLLLVWSTQGKILSQIFPMTSSWEKSAPVWAILISSKWYCNFNIIFLCSFSELRLILEACLWRMTSKFQDWLHGLIFFVSLLGY